MVQGSCIGLILATCITTLANTTQLPTSIRPFNNPPYVSFTIVYYILLFFRLPLGQTQGFCVRIDAAGSYRKSGTCECSVVRHLASIQQVISLYTGWYDYTEMLQVLSLQITNASFAR